MVSSSWNGEGLDDWESALERPDGHPAAALAIGGIAIAVIAAVAFASVTIDVARSVWPALGIAVLGAAMVYAIAWFVTLRHAGTGWRIGVGAGFVALAAMTVTLAVVAAKVAERAEVAALDRITLDAQGEPKWPSGVRRGPILRSGMDYLRAMNAEQRMLDKLLIVELGLDRLANADAVTADPRLLTDCGRFAMGKVALDASDRRIAAAVATYRDTLTGAISDGALRRMAIEQTDKGATEGLAKVKQVSALQHSQLDKAGPLCTLLAKHNWRNRGNMFEFSSQAELNAFDRQVTAWNETVRQANELDLARKNLR